MRTAMGIPTDNPMITLLFFFLFIQFFICDQNLRKKKKENFILRSVFFAVVVDQSGERNRKGVFVVFTLIRNRVTFTVGI